MKKVILACIFATIVPVFAEPVIAGTPLLGGPTLSTSDRILARAFKSKTSGFMVKFQGTVIEKLPDDTEGSRHQRFIVRLESKQTLLIAHNIDLAPRVSKLKVSNMVTIYGEYIWNDQGGLVHQTHRLPNGSAGGGWIRHRGVLYR